MLSETSRQWLEKEWGTKNPVRIDSQTAWEILQEAHCGGAEAKEVWKEYADHKRLPEDSDEALKVVNTYDKFLSKIYVERIRW